MHEYEERGGQGEGEPQAPGRSRNDYDYEPRSAGGELAPPITTQRPAASSLSARFRVAGEELDEYFATTEAALGISCQSYDPSSTKGVYGQASAFAEAVRGSGLTAEHGACYGQHLALRSSGLRRALRMRGRVEETLSRVPSSLRDLLRLHFTPVRLAVGPDRIRVVREPMLTKRGKVRIDKATGKPRERLVEEVQDSGYYLRARLAVEGLRGNLIGIVHLTRAAHTAYALWKGPHGAAWLRHMLDHEAEWEAWALEHGRRLGPFRHERALDGAPAEPMPPKRDKTDLGLRASSWEVPTPYAWAAPSPSMLLEALEDAVSHRPRVVEEARDQADRLLATALEVYEPHRRARVAAAKGAEAEEAKRIRASRREGLRSALWVSS